MLCNKVRNKIRRKRGKRKGIRKGKRKNNKISKNKWILDINNLNNIRFSKI